jgi:membrane protein YdbS with pleckstrin-like domain
MKDKLYFIVWMLKRINFFAILFIAINLDATSLFFCETQEDIKIRLIIFAVIAGIVVFKVFIYDHILDEYETYTEEKYQTFTRLKRNGKDYK